MLDLTRLKSEVISKLILTLNQNGPKTGFSNISLDCPRMDLLNLLSFINSSTLAYFSSRNKNSEILGCGYVARFSEKEKNDVNKIISQNPSLKFFTCMRFNGEIDPANEWKTFADFAFILPMVSWIKEENVFSIEINFPNEIRENLNQRAEFILALENQLLLSSFFNPTTSVPSFGEHLDIPTKDLWDSTIDKCLNSLAETPLNKVVLARKRILNLGPFNPVEYFQKLSSQCENSFSFFIKLSDQHAFFSFTPELLFQKIGRNIILDSIAGTRKRGINIQDDQLLERELKSSKKELTEHRIVSREIHDLLVGICENINTPLLEGILKQKHVQHLHTIFNGQLSEDLGIFDIINKVHPTPAVGGHPKNLAVELISRLEDFDRGIYAAPIGIISKEKSELGVGIRSALLFQQQLHVFGGAGIVLGSTAEKEWDETYNKMKNFLE